MTNGTPYIENRFFFLNDEDKARVLPTIPVSQRYGKTILNVVTMWRPLSRSEIEARWQRWTPFGLR